MDLYIDYILCIYIYIRGSVYRCNDVCKARRSNLYWRPCFRDEPGEPATREASNPNKNRSGTKISYINMANQ